MRSARAAAAHGTRWWATAAHPALHMAFPNQYFDALGIPRQRVYRLLNTSQQYVPRHDDAPDE